MAMRWKDIKQKSSELFNEFKQHRVGILGLSIIVVLLILGIFAPLIAPNTNGSWNDSMRWRDNPKKAPPVWWDYFTSDKMARHKVQTSPEAVTTENHSLASLNAGGVKYTNVTYKYNNDADLPPRDLITYISGEHADNITIPPGYHEGDEGKTVSFNPTVRISVRRPDGRTLKLASTKIQTNETFGAGGENTRFSLIKSRESKNTLYRFGQTFYDTHKYGENNTLTFQLNRTYDKSGNSVPATEFDLNTNGEVLGPRGNEKGDPEIKSAYPGEGVEGFDIGDDPVVEFSESIDTTSFSYVLRANGAPDPGDINTSWNWDNSKVTFLTDNLSYDQSYSLVITNAEDLETNNLEGAPYSFSFTTAERAYQFSLNRTQYEDTLIEGPMNETLKTAFEDEGYNVSDDAEFARKHGKMFIFEGEEREYVIEEDVDDLNIYREVDDTIEPEITNIYPSPDSTMARDKDITITFSESVKKDTFDFNYTQGDGSFSTDGVHTSWNENNTVVKISHDSPIPPLIDVKSPQVLFGKANNNILSLDPDPLKGDYYFNISIVGKNTELDFGEDDGQMIYAGRVYGWMGTDDRGRDIGKAWVWGARYALLLGGIVATTTVAIGTVYGMTSAYFGGWIDELMQRGNEVVIGIPLLPMLIIMMFIWKQSLWIMIFLMCLLYWRGIAKTIRARGLQIKQSTFVEAAESLGAGGGRIITTHMIPQILPYSVAEAALIVPGVIVAEASLSVLGLGDPNIVTWGKLLSEANSASATVQGLWWWVLLPGIGITIVGFAFIATGMAIEKVVQPKMKQR